MSANVELPTLDRLNAKLPDNLDARQVAIDWLSAFGERLEAGDVEGATALMLEDAYWRDTLALTWDFHTFEGCNPRITSFLHAALPVAKPSKIKLAKEEYLSLAQPFPDLAWIQGFFSFETETGIGSGVFRIVPTATPGEWKAHSVYTNLEDLKGFPEAAGDHRKMEPDYGMWEQKRAEETAFEGREPAVVIVGGGQSGLVVAARLKLLGVPCLILEKNARIGDQWRKRYEALCLHDPVWYDHLPYIPFPTSWPTFTPSRKFAGWLEFYAQAMEVDIWLSTRIDKIEQGQNDLGWRVHVRRSDGSSRILEPRHVVFAYGFGGGGGRMPKYPGMDTFGGKILHSTEYGRAQDHEGKKVVVIGACNSAHDIAQNCVNHGVDVTMYQRSSTYVMTVKKAMPLLLSSYWGGKLPTEIADRTMHSFPKKFSHILQKRVTPVLAELDKDILDGLHRVGFRTNLGPDGMGLLPLALDKLGGYYLDTGASQLIIDGKIKLKSQSQISHFTEHSVVFEDGSELHADVVIFATGYTGNTALVKQLIGEDVASKIGEVWGLNEEGELKNVCRRVAVPGLYFMFGNLAICRYHSKHLALLIKALEEGILKDPKVLNVPV